MKPQALIALTLAVALAGCQKPSGEQAAPTPAPTAETNLTPVAETPVATPPPVVEKTTPPPPDIAPEGIFYLIAPVSLDTGEGIHALTPGTGVKLVRDGVYLTPIGEIPIPSEKLTNNLTIARHARDSFRAGQVRRSIPAPVETPATPVPVQAVTPTKPLPAPVQPQSGLGATHSRTKDGWLWQKNARGEWQKVRRLE